MFQTGSLLNYDWETQFIFAVFRPFTPGVLTSTWSSFADYVGCAVGEAKLMMVSIISG